MSTSQSAQFFDAIARRYDRVYALDRDASRRRMARVLAALPPAPARLLDLGVGTGRELGALQDAGYEPVGVDISAQMLAQCARRARPVTLVNADLWGPLPFEDGAFAAALALHGTLSHPPDDEAPARFAREIARVLAPGGVLIFEVPTPTWLERIAGGTEHAGSEMHVSRLDGRTCVHHDRVAGVAIEATIRSAAEWEAALAPALVAHAEAIDPFELFVVARRLETLEAG